MTFLKSIPGPFRRSASRFLPCLGLVAFIAVAQTGEVFTLKWQESGVREKLRGYRPHSLMLSTNIPEGLKNQPAALHSPYYGALKFGGAKPAASFLVLVDKVDGKPSRLFVDANGNGDLTDESGREWTARNYTNNEDVVSTTYYSEAMVPVPLAEGPRPGKLVFYMDGRSGTAARQNLGYYGDYGLAGEVKIDGKTYPAILEDSGCVGEFRITGNTMETPIFWLGTGDGGGRGVAGISTLVSRPFQVDGKWWGITNLTPSGSFQIAAAAKPLPVKKAASGPDLSPGKKAPPFAAKFTDGKAVKFPEDYKGKVVLLDFWATWCGPCVAEIPNVVAAYGKYHSQGLEVVGVSLDRENWEEKLAAFTKKKEMPWPQVYDGKFWSAEVAKLYGISAIPHMLLVDGSTGVILADKDIRGEALAPAIEKALASRKP